MSLERPSQRVINDIEEAVGHRELMNERMTQNPDMLVPVPIFIPKDYLVDLVEITNNAMEERAMDEICESPTLDSTEDVAFVINAKFKSALKSEEQVDVDISPYEEEFINKWLSKDSYGNEFDDNKRKRNDDIKYIIQDQVQEGLRGRKEKSNYLDDVDKIIKYAPSGERILEEMKKDPRKKEFMVVSEQMARFERLLGQYILDADDPLYTRNKGEIIGHLKPILKSIKRAKVVEWDEKRLPVMEKIDLTGKDILNSSAFIYKMFKTNRLIPETTDSGYIIAFIQKLKDDFHDAPVVDYQKTIKNFISRMGRQDTK